MHYTSRMTLRLFDLSDVDDFLKWASDDKVTHYLRWDTITSREEALSYIKEVAIPQKWRQSICIDNHSIGYVSIKPESGSDRHRAHVGFAIGYKYWGLGIMTEVMRMAIPRAFEKFPFLVRLEALVEEENIGSQRVLEKVGFTREGFLRKYGFNKGEIRDLFIVSCLQTKLPIEQGHAYFLVFTRFHGHPKLFPDFHFKLLAALSFFLKIF